MNSGMVSMRYARALFNYALKNKVEDAVYAEMKTLSESFVKQRNLRATLDNPVLRTKDKFELIKAAGGNTVSQEYIRFIELVLHQKREKHLQTISLGYLDLYRNYKNISVGKLITACPVDQATVDKIKQLVLLKKTGVVDFVTEVNPTIEGGFVLYIDTYRLDASVASQLKRIKNQLLSRNKKVA